MEQRDSLERSSSENPAPQSTLNGSGYDAGNEVPTGGQTTFAPQSTLPTNESSPVVDSVLQSDVGLLARFPYKHPKLRIADWHQHSAHAAKAERRISKRIRIFLEEEIYPRGGASARPQKIVQK